MGLPAFISDEDMMSFEQAQMPQVQGSVRFEPQPPDGAPTIPQAQAPQVGFISDEQMAQMEAQSAPPQVDLLGGGNTAQRMGRNIIGGVSQLLPLNAGDEMIGGGAAAVDSGIADTAESLGTSLINKLRSYGLGATDEVRPDNTSLGQNYDRRLQEIRNYQDSYNQLSPDGGYLPAIAGAVAMPGGAANKVKGVIPKLAAMSAEGGILGFGYGYGSGRGTEDRLSKGKDSAKVGAIAAPAAYAAIKTLGAIGSKVKDGGKALGRKSFGASYADYVKSADDINATSLSDEAVSKTRQNLDDLAESGELGKTRNPAKLKKIVAEKSRKLAQDIDSEIRAAQSGPVVGSFPRAQALLDEGNIPADQIPRYERRLKELASNIVKFGKGKLTYLQQQKIAQGKLYDPNDTLANNFNRAIYHDLQETIERAAPKVKPLNKQLEKLMTVAPILQRGAAKLENADIIQKGINLTKTTGGFGVPIMLGSSVAGPVGAAVGVAGSMAMNPQGQRVLGETLRKVGSAASKANKIDVPTVARTLSAVASRPETPSKLPDKSQTQKTKSKSQTLRPESLKPSPSDKTTNSQLDSKVESMEPLDKVLMAIRKVESGGNDKAVSKVGAKGPYQLMDDTGKEYHAKLGIKEPYDPFNEKQAKKIATAILMDYTDQMGGDLAKGIVAYHSGPKNVKEGKLGPEGRKYLPSVLKALEAIT
jgi:hypothetical protein